MTLRVCGAVCLFAVLGCTEGKSSDSGPADSVFTDVEVLNDFVLDSMPDTSPDAPFPDLAVPDTTQPTCSDGKKNGMETDVDCGGGACGKCAVGKKCKGAHDCVSAVCTNNVCVASTCSDGVKNGLETDVDCGGTCTKCLDGKTCKTSNDCVSMVCTGNKCASPSCTDNIKNGTETDTDCGGTCPPCLLGKSCKLSKDCSESVCEAAKCRWAKHCKELRKEQQSLGDGAYRLDVDGTGPTASFQAYCDMTTDGGGWTALLNPANNTKLSNVAFPGVTKAFKLLSGTQTCTTTPAYFVANKWNGIRAYACGYATIKVSVSWSNILGATDVMFIAALQGETQHELSINGQKVLHDAFTSGYMKCFFWNSTATSATPKPNQCWSTSLDALPHVYKKKYTGNLTIDMVTGPSCLPSCQYGTGMNIQKLFVR